MQYLLLIFLLISLNGSGQCKTFITGVKKDTLNCTDYAGKKQGRWVNEFPALRGERGFEEQGVYINGLKEGTWQRFSLQGDLQAIENYRWGNKDGRCFYFTPFGQPLREEYWRAVNPDNPYDTVDVYDLKDPQKIAGTVIVKLDGHSLRHGTWKYYDSEFGTVEKTEVYHMDKIKNGKEPDPVDDLAPIDISAARNAKRIQPDTTDKKTSTKPKAVLDFEKKNSGKKSIKVRDGKTGY